MKSELYRPIAGLTLLTALLLSGCGSDENPEASCGEGDEVTVDSKAYCVYRQAVVVENGFECPADRPHLTQQGGLGICSDRREIPERDVEQIGDEYRDDHPEFEDCLFNRECADGEICEAGACTATGNNANSSTNNATNSGTNSGTNSATTGDECTNDADCVSGQVCEAGECLGTCGGFAGFTCADTEWCDYPDDSTCGAADQLGFCRPRPDECATVVDPVCGCDNNDYGNECEAQRAGVDVVGAGMCP